MSHTTPPSTPGPVADASSPASSPSAAVPPATPPKNLRRLVFVLIFVLAVLFLIGALPKWRGRSALAAETRELAIPSVIVVSPVRGTNETSLTLPGEVRPYLEASIHPRVTGYVKRWFADIGTMVTAGTVLAEIDTPELDQELAKAKASLTEAESHLAFARTSAARWTELVKNASVSKQETEEKLNEVGNRAAAVEAAKAEVHRLEDLQHFQKLTAPFDGQITRRSTDVGELVTAGSGKELFHLVQSRELRVFVRIPQTATRQVTTGQVATVSIAEIPGKKFEGTVVRSAGALDPTSRTLLIEVGLSNPAGEILPGSYAQVKFTGLPSAPALTLPANTLLFRSEGPQAAVLNSDSTVTLRNVKLGRDLGNRLEILSGITDSDRVVLNPSDSLASGTKVQVIQPAAK